VGLWKLKLTMAGTLGLVIGLTTLILAAIMSFTGYFSLQLLIGFVVAINIAQWMVAPYIIDAIYHVRPLSPREYPWLHAYVKRIAEKSGIEPPKLMLAEIPIPNAFAYGSPIAGRRVAVTTGLLQSLPREEVEAVVAHEIGHLKHRDMEVMMIASIMPAIIYILGRWLMLAGIFSGGRRDERGGSIGLFAIGALLMTFSFVLNLIVLGLSRLREYYADAHAALTVNNGAIKLQRALARIVLTTKSLKVRGLDVSNYSQFRALFIADPARAIEDSRAVSSIMYGRDNIMREIERIKASKLTLWDRILELFSTHPNIIKRLKALDNFARAA